MTWSDLIALWAAEALASDPATVADLPAALRRLANLIELASTQLAGGGARPANEQEKLSVFALLSEISNAQTNTPTKTAYRLAVTMASVALLRTLQDYGLFEGI